MNDTPDNAGQTMLPGSEGGLCEPADNAVERRVFRNMGIAVGAAVLVSLPFAQWRITAGLLVGGLLSLLNHHWLSTSSAAAFSVIARGTKPQLKLTQYLLRYLVVGAVVVIVYRFNLVSLAATIAGLCSFVVALFVEAAREFYFAVIHREETS